MATPDGTGQIRVALWAPPRSLSTAFERCISTLHAKHSLAIYHEPYTAAFHLGPEKQVKYWVPFSGYIARAPEYTYPKIKKRLEENFVDKDIVFFKDLGHSVNNKYEFIPKGFKHSFLIRDPEKVLTSFYKILRKRPLRYAHLKLSSVFPKGWIYEEMFNLYEYLTKELGEKVVIIDAEDLVRNPRAMLELYCRETGIPFSEDMLHWRTGEEDMRDWSYSKKLMKVARVCGQYDRAFSSDGLGAPSNRVINVDKYPRDCRKGIDHAEPFYRKLYEKRLRPPGDNAGCGGGEYLPEVA